jgi:diguanylate cyclase (GGDEF)-like protein
MLWSSSRESIWEPGLEKKRILLVEADHASAASLARRLWAASLVVDTATTAQGALVRVRELKPAVTVVHLGEESAELCRRLRRSGRGGALLLVLPADCPDPDELARRCGADGYLLEPLNAGAVVSCARWAASHRELLDEIEQLREELDERALAPLPGAGDSARFEFDLFKRVLLLEVRRSRRYGYPLSFLMIAVDRYESSVGRLRLVERTRFMKGLLRSVRATIRDIDLAVADGEDRFLVCLPQTDLDGARYVAERLRDRLPRVAQAPTITVSIGVSAWEGAGEPPSFKSLFKRAMACLDHARSHGGDRVEMLPELTRRKARST